MLAPWIAPHDPNEGNLSNAMLSPVWHGGTWELPDGHRLAGLRRALSRLLYGARTSLFIGTVVVLLAGTFGVLVGLFAGYKGGRADRWLMGWVDVQVSFPGLLLAMLLIALVGGSVMYGHDHPRHQRLDGLRPHDARRRALGQGATVRRGRRAGRVQAEAGRVQAHPAQPASARSATLAVLEFARIILAEAALSFLGLGIQYPGVSWGLDIARASDHELFGNQWLIIYPGILLSLTVLAVNLLSSWLRVALDPQEREKRFAATAIGSGAKTGGGL